MHLISEIIEAFLLKNCAFLIYAPEATTSTLRNFPPAASSIFTNYTSDIS